MKRNLLTYLLVFLAQGFYAQVFAETKYVDLGLPSGTKWAVENEEKQYTFYEAYDLYPNQLPTEEQFRELVKECTYMSDGEKIYFVGKTGDTISFTLGYYHIFKWKKAGYYTNEKIHLGAFYSVRGHSDKYIFTHDLSERLLHYYTIGNQWKAKFRKPAPYPYEVVIASDLSYSTTYKEEALVRLVENPSSTTPIRPKNNFYFFGPDDTTWSFLDEEGEYSYSDLQRLSFRDSLPTLREWRELIKFKKWEWTGRGYLVGGSLFFPLHPETSRHNSDTLLFLLYNYLYNPSPYHDIPEISDSIKFKARLVYNPKPAIMRNDQYFIDLGLPSGTKWCSYSEEKSYSWFGASHEANKVPTREQFEELLKYCKIKVLKYDRDRKAVYLLTGPNGRQIILTSNYYWTLDLQEKESWGAYVYHVSTRPNDRSSFLTSKNEDAGVHYVK